MRAAGINSNNYASQQTKLRSRIDEATQSITKQSEAESRASALRTKYDRGVANAASVSFVGQAASRVGRGAMNMVRSPFAAAVNFEDEMAGVDKFVKGADIPKLREQILSLGKASPLGASGLARLVAEAGKTGLAADDAFRSATITERAAVAFGVSVETAAERNNKFRASMNMSLDQVAQMNDAINYFGDNSESNADNISNIITRSGAVAKSAGFADAEIAALAATLDAVAPNAEIAATSMKNIASSLTVGDSVSGKAKSAYQQIGLDPEAIARSMVTDAAGG